MGFLNEDLTCDSAPHHEKPPGHMAAFQTGTVVPDEDKSPGKERTYSTWYSFHFPKREKSFYCKAMQDLQIGRMTRLTQAISTRPTRPTLSAVFATNEEVIPGAPCSIVTALTVLKYTAT